MTQEIDIAAPEFAPGMNVVFRRKQYRIVALGDRPGTFDLHPHSFGAGEDSWRNVPPSELTAVDETGDFNTGDSDLDTLLDLVFEMGQGIQGNHDVGMLYADSLEAVQAKLKDAARWKYARDLIGPGVKCPEWENLMALVGKQPDTPEGFEAAIDEAMQGEGE